MTAPKRAAPKKKKKARRPLHRITTLVLTYAVTARGSKWRLLRGRTVLWSMPATGKGAITRDTAIAKARGYLFKHGIAMLLDDTAASCLPVPMKFRPGAHFNTRARKK